MFDGHQFIKLSTEEWVFDITEYRGYKVKLNSSGEVDSATLAFIVNDNNNEISFEKLISVPVKVLKETKDEILKYKNSAFV